MPWVRFDDQFPIHRRIAGLSDGAFRLHVAAICWCARNLTDGYVASVDVEHVSRSRRPWRQVDELVGAGTWHVVDGGWLIHDYLEYQPSKAQVEQERKGRAERQARWRAKHTDSRRVTNASRNAFVDATPPRPDPSRPVGRVGEGADSDPPYRASNGQEQHHFQGVDGEPCADCGLPAANRRHALRLVEGEGA